MALTRLQPAAFTGGISGAGITDASIAPVDLTTGHPTWDSSGNLGVGTASPSYKLDVDGAINSSQDIITQGSVGGRLSLYRTDGSNYIDWSSAQALAFRTETSSGGSGATERMRITSSGNVGIQNVAPLAKLVVGAAQTLPDPNTISQFSGPVEFCSVTALSYRMQIETDSSATYFGSNTYYSGGWQVYDSGRAPAQMQLVSENLDSSIRFHTSATNSGNGTERVRIDKSGNMHVGAVQSYRTSLQDTGVVSAGGFESLSYQITISSATSTTIFSVGNSTTETCCGIIFVRDAGGLRCGSSGLVTVVTDGANYLMSLAAVSNLGNGANLVQSGNSINFTHSYGSARTFTITFMRIGNSKSI